MAIRRQRVKGAQRRTVNDEPNVGLTRPANAVDVVLDIAEHEHDAIDICKMVDHALPRAGPSCGNGLSGPESPQQQRDTGTQQRSTFHDSS